MAQVRRDVDPATMARETVVLRVHWALVPDPRFGATYARLGVDNPDPAALRRVTLTDAGHAQYAPLRGAPQRAGLRLPDPPFSTKIPAGRRSSTAALPPTPGGQPDPHPQAGKPSVGQPRWARCPDKGRLHQMRPTEVIASPRPEPGPRGTP